ncbi:MAG: dephospho-CoA kinase [Gemmatimonadales bacterium]|nr:dephospho-CoA kinase [Gemmatimonadales bacterium]
MLHVGLTGNVAAGKSTVSACLARLGAHLIDADRIVRDLQQPGTPVFHAIVERFGPGVVAADGALDRPALRARILADDAERRALEAIVHPAVAVERAHALDAARAAGATVAISDIPLLFEVMDPAGFDAVVLVDAPAPLRQQRLVERRGLAADEAARLVAAQAPSAPKRAHSTFVLDNDADPAELERRAGLVWRALLARARTPGPA